MIDKERIYKIYNEGITRVITQEYTSDNKIIDEAYYDKTTVNLLNLHHMYNYILKIMGRDIAVTIFKEYVRLKQGNLMSFYY